MKRMNVLDVPIDFKHNDSLSYCVVLRNGKKWRTYRITDAKRTFIEDGIKLYIYTKTLFPITLLIAWK